MSLWQYALATLIGVGLLRRVCRWFTPSFAYQERWAFTGDACPHCDGTGEEERVHGYATCTTCDGRGARPVGMLSPRAGARLWRSARSIDELGRLTARWLRGELPTCLTYDGPADDETAEIVDTLISLNEAGWLTDFSQPGEPWTPGCGDVEWRQRAAVTFLVPGSKVAQVTAAALREVLWVDARPAPYIGAVESWKARHRRIPISQIREPGQPAEWTCGVGFVLPRSHWRWIGRGWRSLRLGRLLADAWQVTVVDLEWGANERLWSNFTARLLTPSQGECRAQ